MAIAYVRSATANDSSVDIDCGSADTDRLLVIYCHIEGDVGWLSNVTADGKNMTLVDRVESGDNFGQSEMWYIDEDVLTTSSGTITLAITGGSASYVLNAMLFTGVDQSGPTDYGNYGTTNATDVVVPNITSSDDSVIIFGSYEGQGAGTTVSWTSPLTQRSTQVGSSNSQFTASCIETTGQTNKTYTHVWGPSTRNRIGGIIGVWSEASSVTYEIAGVTYDKNGDILVSCDVFLCRDNGDDTASFLEHTTSHGTTGAYSFQDAAYDSADHFVIAWKDNTPHVFDCSDHVLAGEEV